VSDAQDHYEAGDVNRIDDEGPDATDHNTMRGSVSSEVLAYLARSMADEPDAVSVDVSEHGSRVVLALNVAPGDMGRVIGRRGRTAQALRTLVAAAGSREGVTTSVDIVD
jgi:predicted RNA-binding protein YlqC (UPF0109 family)